MHKKSLEIEEKLGRPEGMASDYASLALVYQRGENLEKAEEMHLKGLKIEEKIGRLEGIARQHANLGTLYKQQGDFAKARAYWEKALELFKKIGMKPDKQKVQKWIDELNEK